MTSSLPDASRFVRRKFAVVGGGVCGLTATYALAKSGHEAVLYEADEQIGGLASAYAVGGQRLEKFYHHWLGTDQEAFNLIKEIGKSHKLKFQASNVGIYYANQIYRFSSPMDLLRFKPLGFFDRLRFGLSILYSWFIKDHTHLEKISAVDWLERVVGKKTFDVIWRPLLVGKFGALHEDIAAIWLWNKLIQRGKSRDTGSREQLGYYVGGFGEFLDDLSEAAEQQGAKIYLKRPVSKLRASADGHGVELLLSDGSVERFDGAIMAVPVPDAMKLVAEAVPADYLERLGRVKYLANVCLILKLRKSLSQTYWMNVNDPDFPFVGIIEHTNFESAAAYEGNHLVYLSKYLPEDAPLYQMGEEAMLEFSVPHIQRMFPEFRREDIISYSVWKAKYAQPVITLNYPEILPSYETPLPNVMLSTMAQVYPQDRGTNYAIVEGKKVAQMLASSGS